MEEIVYLSVRIGCAGYLLYKLWNQKNGSVRLRAALYPREKGEGGRGNIVRYRIG